MASRKYLRQYLGKDLANIQEIKTLEENRIDVLIKRISEFVSSSKLQVINNSNVTSQQFRRVVIEAAINFISFYPMLKHTPASLRNLFSVPTRQDRKKGKYSTQYLRDKAEAIGRKPDWKTLNTLKSKLTSLNLRSPFLRTHRAVLVDYIENDILKRDLPLPPAIHERNDHTDFSINRLKSFFSTFPQVTSILEAEPSINGESTPDLILKLNDSIVWWFELKEWEDFELVLKPAYQVIRYLIEAGNVIFWIEGLHNTFFDDLPEIFPVSMIIEKVKYQLRILKDREAELRGEYRAFWKIGKILHRKLTTEEKAVYLTILDEITAEELGLLYADKKAGKTLLKMLVENLKPSEKILKTSFSFEKLLDPQLPTILIQKNFQWNE
ncbi:MAG: hypothetical protein ACFFC7_04660 [Candidatus Hermodarchaeota archaeon]